MGEPETGKYEPVAKWPEGEGSLEDLAGISERVLEERCGLLKELSPSRYGVAYPVLIDGGLYGVVAVDVSASGEDELKSAMQQLQWGVAALELFFRRRRIKDDEAAVARLKLSVDLLASVLAAERFEDAAMALVTQLATRLGCERISLGFVKKGHIEVRAISHSASFGKRMNLINAIGKAMEEAILQRREIVYPLPPDTEMLITRDHEALSELNGTESVLTLPVYGDGRYYGALTLERPGEAPFGEEEVNVCRGVLALAAPALRGKHLQSRLLIYHIADSLKRQAARLFGARHLGRKLAVAGLAGLAVFFIFAGGQYRVTADAALEGSVRRSIVTPFTGYIKEARARAGDVVREDSILCAFDDRELRMERLNWMSQQTQLQRQHMEALATRERAKANIIKAQIEQAAAQLSLVESKLERTRIRAPFDGVVVNGDLSQRLGGVSEQGEALFELAPLKAYRVILQVDESRIGDVREGQTGKLLLSSISNEYFDFTVKKTTPLSATKEGKNYFRVEAELDKVSERLRPGMEGVGKIYVDRRKLVSIWTRNLRDWLRLKVWSWWP